MCLSLVLMKAAPFDCWDNSTFDLDKGLSAILFVLECGLWLEKNLPSRISCLFRFSSPAILLQKTITVECVLGDLERKEEESSEAELGLSSDAEAAITLQGRNVPGLAWPCSWHKAPLFMPAWGDSWICVLWLRWQPWHGTGSPFYRNWLWVRTSFSLDEPSALISFALNPRKVLSDVSDATL